MKSRFTDGAGSAVAASLVAQNDPPINIELTTGLLLTKAATVGPASAGATRVAWHEMNAVFAGGAAAASFSDTAIYAQQMILYAAAGNADNVEFGPDSTIMGRSLAATDQFYVYAPAGCCFNLADWYGQSDGAGDVTLHILYV